MKPVARDASPATPPRRWGHLAVLMSAVALAACGGSDDAPAPSATDTTPTSASAPPAPTPPAPTPPAPTPPAPTPPAPTPPAPTPPAPTPPAPTPPAPGGLTSYVQFAAAAPTARSVAPAGALAWLEGTWYGRSSAGPCEVALRADGTASATINGSTQHGALDGEAGDTWVQQPTNSWAFGINVMAPGQGVSLTGYAGRLVLAEIGGVLDKCAIAFRSATPLTMAIASAPPLPIKSTGLAAADLPAWLVGTHAGHVAGSFLYPRAATGACSLQVAADGTVTLQADGRSYSAQVSGGASASDAGDRDASDASRVSAYSALTGARGWLWLVTAQSPAPAGETVQIEIELAHTGERSQVSHATAQFRPFVGGLARQFDSCYFAQ